MKLVKIYEKVKKYLSLIEDKQEIEKKKIKKLQEKIEDKISKIEQKIKELNNIEEKERLKKEIIILKEFKKQLKNKK
ncbi:MULTISPECIES: hypothetical protein [Arcobacter]|jgi:hypothetical protein|uniref:Uncharacterized protein n=1 Tax=Arcobacter ellisii TaxID=913109 RepID=A0A347U612_9BACT|nr:MULTISPECIES: hypothetical protein [Arcobacter]AXX94290.1 hypothetical protein AELL_0601 [Arcobacter ellisii]MDY3204059.1 hypothetical protein [Arcobacter sp.]RXI30993.1 hypothetical protein CP962_05880 [Arcobacter ellisii]